MWVALLGHSAPDLCLRQPHIAASFIAAYFHAFISPLSGHFLWQWPYILSYKVKASPQVISQGLFASISYECDNQHYFKHVTQLGEQRSVVTTSPIYSSQGIKLVDSNVRVDSALYERLIAHRLSPQTIDSCLTAEDSVSVTMIRMRALNLLETNPSLALMHPLNERCHLLRVIDGVLLNEAIAFRLTVMQSHQPGLFDHSIAVMLIALFFGIRSNMPLETLSSLATAAMLHDIGELHVDPKLLNRAHRLSTSERRQVYAHPLIGFLTLSSHSIYQGAICTAVLEHHERIDGSGYPYGLTGDRISVLGNVLALAELMAGLFDSNEAATAWQRLAIILKLGQNRFRHQYLNHIATLLAIAPYAEVDHKSLDAVQLAEPLTRSRFGGLARYAASQYGRIINFT